MKLKEYLKDARNSHYAIGHFNFATEDVLRAIVEASMDAGAPCVMVGTSEGEVEFFGMKEAVAVVKAMREHFNYPIFLNADHFKSFEKCKEAIDAGYDSVIIDASKLPYHENIAAVKKTVNYAYSVNPDISVEGELGYLKGSSEIQQKVEIGPADYTQPNLAFNFISNTGIDRLAVVFGNIHGIVTDQEEKLDIDHLKKIKLAIDSSGTVFKNNISLVLHGASGLKDEDVSAAIKAGINNVHFNTELRVAYHDSIAKTMHDKPSETTPYKYLRPADEEVKKVVMAKIRMFTPTPQRD